MIQRGLSAGSKFLRRKFGLGGDGSEQPSRPQQPRTVPMRIEPKTYFANERTFLSWLHTAVLIGTIGAGLVSVHMGRAGQPRQDSTANTPDPNYTGSAPHERVLTIVHKHEYRVVFPRDWGLDDTSPMVMRGGVDGEIGGSGLWRDVHGGD